MKKYGFIYVWYDRKHKKYYLGRHWGLENDGYICSSTNMRNNFKNRPEDFKRRIVSRIHTSIEDLIVEEQRWLDMINLYELNEKYYNKTKSSTTPSTKGYNHTTETKIKISLGNKGKKLSDDTKQLLREANKKQFEDPYQIQLRKQKSKELWSDTEYLKKQNKARLRKGFYKGFNGSHTEETKKKISLKNTGFVHDEKTKQNISKTLSNMVWITDGNTNTRINKEKKIPEGFRKGRSMLISSRQR